MSRRRRPIRFVASRLNEHQAWQDDCAAAKLSLDGAETRTFYEGVISREHGEEELPTTAVAPPRVTKTRRTPAVTETAPVDPTRRCSAYDQNRLLYHCQHGDLPALEHLLRTEPLIDVNHEDAYGWTPLMIASREGRAEVVRRLLQREDVLVSARSSEGLTACQLAASDSIRALFPTPRVGEDKKKRASNSSSKDSRNVSNEDRVDCDVCAMENVSLDHSATIVHQLNRRGTSRRCRKHYGIARGNVGYRMLVEAGWDPQRGLGRYEQGASYPVPTRLKRDRLCIGNESQSQSRVTHRDVDCNRSRWDTPRVKHVRKESVKDIARKFRNEFKELDY